MADTEIALRIDISIRRPFSIFRANEKKERKEKFSFLIQDQVFTDRSIFPSSNSNIFSI